MEKTLKKTLEYFEGIEEVMYEGERYWDAVDLNVSIMEYQTKHDMAFDDAASSILSPAPTKSRYYEGFSGEDVYGLNDDQICKWGSVTLDGTYHDEIYFKLVYNFEEKFAELHIFRETPVYQKVVHRLDGYSSPIEDCEEVCQWIRSHWNEVNRMFDRRQVIISSSLHKG